MSGRKKNERGLFGIVKKKSVLFTFNPRKGEECSSDSDDSDYFPGRHSTDEDDVEAFFEKEKLKVAKKRVKKAAALVPKQRSKRSRRDIKSDAENHGAEKGLPCRLPPEILLRIFIYGARSEGITRFLPRVSRVCKEWHETASDPSLLKHLNLSAIGEGNSGSVINFTKQRLDMLLSSRDLSHCQTLCLAGQDKLAVGHIKTMLAQTPRLTSLDLRGCQANSDMVHKLPELNPSLERIDLSQLSPTSSLSHKPVALLLTTFGPKLVELRLRGMGVIDGKLEGMLTALGRSCPLLEELDISRAPRTGINLSQHVVDIGEFGRACPRLTELRLDGYNIVDASEETEPYSAAFPRLRIYSQSTHLCQQILRSAFYRIFAKNELDALDISHTNLKPSLLGDITSKVLSVKRLYLSNMFWGREYVKETTSCMYSWFESLEMLDLSENKRECFNDEFSFFDHPSSGLHTINLAHSVVNSENVVNILRNCKSLRTIDLTGCRELPRGYKRAFHHKEFPNLIKSLST